MGTSMQQLYHVLTTEGFKSGDEIRNEANGWIDVRDLAEGHFRALTFPEASGERIIICSSEKTSKSSLILQTLMYCLLNLGAFVWQEWRG